MAIDQDIEQRVNAYRNNPQALQQRYAQNQQLLDLLALQRLKSEKDDAARKVQMEMQQNPQTIKQQREQQLLDMTKQDLAKQTAGIMQTAQQRQQKNMQRIAKQGAASPQQMQRVASGLGALAQRQQQQAPRRMAAGGVVALQAGGDVTQAEIAEYKRRYTGQSSRRWRGKSDAEIADMIRAERSAVMGGPPDGMELTRRGYRPVLDTAAEQASQVQTAEFEEKDSDTGTPVVAEAETTVTKAPSTPTRREQVADAATAMVADGTADQTAPPAQQGIMELVQAQDNQLVAPTIDTSKVGERGKDILAQTGLGSLQNPETARTTARDAAATYMGREDKKNKMQEYLEELKALDVRQQDPDKLRRERRSAFLRGTAGRSGFGGMMAAGSAAMAGERAKQEKSERDRLMSRINLDKSAMDMDMSIAKDALADGRSAYEQAMANRRQAASVLSSTSNQDIQLAMKEAQLAFDANKGNIRNLLDAAQIQYTDDLRRAMESADAAQRAGKILADLQQKKVEVFQKEAAEDRTLMAARAALQENPDDATAIANYTAAYNALQTRVNALFEMRSGTGQSFNDVEQLLLQMMQGQQPSLGDLSSGATAPTQPSFNTEGWGSLSVR